MHLGAKINIPGRYLCIRIHYPHSLAVGITSKISSFWLSELRYGRPSLVPRDNSGLYRI